MWGDLYTYFSLLWGYARWLLAGGPFLIDTVIKRAKPEWARWLDGYLLPKTRQRIEVTIILLAVFFAGFFAWRDEHVARLLAEGHPEVRRHLTDDEKARLKEVFAGKPMPLIIVSTISGPEPERYAYDFIEFFKSIGFNAVESPNAVPLNDDDVGLMIGIRDKDNPSDAAKLFVKLFLDAGFRVKQVKYAIDQANPIDFDLFVGAQK